MLYRTTTTALALLLGTLAASAQDTAVAPGAPELQATELQDTSLPSPSTIDAAPFPVTPPAAPNLEVLAGNPGEPIGSKDLTSFQETQAAIAPVNSNVMSKYEVRSTRIPAFRLRDVYTHDGLVAYAYDTHPGLHVGNILDSNSAQAYEMFLEDERLARMGDLVDTALAMTVGGDKKEGDMILKEERSAYGRDERSNPLESYEEAPKVRAGTPLIVDFQQMQLNWLYVKF
jgi:hypothetical protein